MDRFKAERLPPCRVSHCPPGRENPLPPQTRGAKLLGAYEFDQLTELVVFGADD